MSALSGIDDATLAAMLRSMRPSSTDSAYQPPATQRQLDFLKDLVATRSAPPELLEEALEKLDEGVTKKEASRLISSLLLYPRSRKNKKKEFDDVELNSPAHRELRETLREMPEAKYAIPIEELMVDLLKGVYSGDLVFVEVKKTPTGRLRLRKLLGAPGDFSRMDVPVEDALTFARLIARDPYEYTKRFAAHHTCCGRCGAALTDELSRKLYLGPVCRQMFAFPVS